MVDKNMIIDLSRCFFTIDLPTYLKKTFYVGKSLSMVVNHCFINGHAMAAPTFGAPRLHCPLAEERLLGAGVAATAARLKFWSRLGARNFPHEICQR